MKKVLLVYADNMVSLRPVNNEPHTSTIHSMLIKNDIQCNTYYNCNEMSVLEQIKKLNPDYLGLYINFCPDLSKIKKFIDRVKEYEPNCQSIVYGLFTNSDKEYIKAYFSKQFDFVICGEPELKFCEIVMNGYRRKTETVFLESEEFDINDITTPYKSAANELNTLISRGCFHNCLFCEEKDFFKGYKYRTVDSVIEELKLHISTSDGTKDCWVFFSDLDFLSIIEKDYDWIKNFYNAIKESKIDIKFSIQTRADRILKNKENLSLLKEIGLQAIAVGVESGSEEVLKRYNKRTRGVSINVESVKLLKELRIPYKINFIMFDPLTTIDNIKENLLFYKNIEYPIGVLSTHPPISFSDKLEILFGTSCHNYYSKNEKINLTFNNYMPSYNFVDDKTRQYYSYVIKWRNINKRIFKNFYQVLNCVIYDEIYINESLKIQRLGYLVKKIDFDFLNDLLSGIEEDKDCDEIVERYHQFLNDKVNSKILQLDSFNAVEKFQFRGWHGPLNYLLKNDFSKQ